MAPEDVRKLAKQFAGTLAIILNPNSKSSDRQSAIKVQDEFMQTSSLCADVGLYFYRNKEQFGSDIRLCGLQLIDFFVKSHWNELDGSKQNQLKSEVFELLKDTEVNEPPFLKEFVVKVFTEVVKRTWPQQWETLFLDLNSLQALGDAQLELVLMIFKVLSEEINGMDDKIKLQRRREMTQTLNTNMSGLFLFFLSTINSKATGLKSNNRKETQRICYTALETINSYSSWVNFEHLLSSDMILFQVLFFLLEVDELKYLACCCLNTIYERKGQPELRRDLVAAVSPNVLGIVQKVARHSNELAKTDEDEYRYLKKLVEAMTNLGNNQIALLWGDDKGFKAQPVGYLEYSQMLLDFLKHDSLNIVNMAAKTWHAFLVNGVIKKNKICRESIPALLDCCLRKMAKCGNPFAKNVDERSSCFNAMDYDEYSDYQQTITGTRSTISQLLQDILVVRPTLPFDHCLLQINNSLQSPFPNTKGLSIVDVKETEHYIYWDALSLYSKRTVTALFHQYPKVLTTELLQKCNNTLCKLLQSNCEQPLFNTLLLKIMENLFPVFKYHQEHLLSTMRMIFKLINVEKTTDKSCIKLQRYACLAFTSICRSIPDILAVIFNDLEVYIIQRLEEKYLTNHEKGILLEGLLQISLSLKDESLKKQFILKITSFIENNFQKDSIQSGIKSPEGLVNLLGLGQCVHTGTMDSDLSRFLLTLYCWLAVVKVCTVVEVDEMHDNPSDVDLNMIHSKYVWIQPMVNVLQHIFELAHNHCMIWTVQDQLSANCKQHMEKTKNVNFTETDFKGDEQMGRGFSVLYLIHDILYTGLPMYASCLGPVFYSLPGMAETIVEKLTTAWAHLPNIKICKIWRNFLRTFISACPARFRQMNISRLLSVSIQSTHQRLSSCWDKFQEQISSVTKSMIEGSSGNESEEVKELKVVYNLSEDFIATLVYLCCYKKRGEKDPNKMDVSRSIGSLGEFLLQCEDTNLHIITSLFSCLTWPHTGVVSRVCELVAPLISHVFTPQKLVSADIPKQLYMQLLLALQKHGADQIGLSSIITASLEFYMHMRLAYPIIVEIMLMVPSCTEQDLKAFDLGNFMESDNQPLTDGRKKKRRECFKKMLEGAVGKSVSTLHKSKVEIKDLPTMAIRKKPKKPAIHACDEEEAGLTNLFGGGDH